ncbi:MAG TPA: type IV pilin N-terminal domain-containing protein, partial [Candidatus Thermoplasmatota archaeon]|nr:type IV pilin N-terminal domain-containing protein [Candidatus Thermoplasmatota archaeon]
MSDVLGALMMVGITVIAAAGFGLLLFSFDGPPDAQHTRLTASVTPGGGDWGDGDELIRLTHVGGEPLARSEALIVFTTPSGTMTLSGSSLGSAFSDGQLTIGETWTHTISADVGDSIDVRIVVSGEQSQLLTSNSIVAGASSTMLCLGDVDPPVVSWTQAPSDLDSTHSGAVTVTATVSDLCSSVLDTPKPHLFYCIDDVVCTPSDAGEMTETGAPGTHQWSKNVDHAGPWLAEAASGFTLYYYVSPISDDVPNSGQSATRSDPIDLVADYTPVDTGFATAGTLADLVNAKAGPDGAEATMTEGAVSSPAGSGGPTKFSGTPASTGGASNPTNAQTSNDVRAAMEDDSDVIDVSGFDLPANANTVTALAIGFEGRRETTLLGTDPSWRLEYKLASDVSYNNGGLGMTSEASTTDVDRTRTLSGITSVSAVEGMTVRVVVDVGNGVNQRDLEVDHVFATVTYTTTAATTYTMTVQLNWTGVDPGDVQQVELRYRTVGDTFTVEAFNFTSLTWRTCSG